MKMINSKLTRLGLTGLAVLCLGASVMAKSAPSYVEIGGKMYSLTPVTQDVKLKNGCTVCSKCKVIDPKGKTTALNNGDTVSSTGVVTPLAKLAHGG
ncbi:MAG TPA: DUF6799 domain-containing protein [Chthoniobacter sp.]|jgi:hypothetical protein